MTPLLYLLNSLFFYTKMRLNFSFTHFLRFLHLLPSASVLKLCTTLKLDYTKSCITCFDTVTWWPTHDLGNSLVQCRPGPDGAQLERCTLHYVYRFPQWFCSSDSALGYAVRLSKLFRIKSSLHLHAEWIWSKQMLRLQGAENIIEQKGWMECD